MKVDTMKENYLVIVVLFGFVLSSLPVNAVTTTNNEKPGSEISKENTPKADIPDQLAQETVVESSNGDSLKPVARHIRQEDGEKYATTTRNIFDLKDLDPLSAAQSAEDYVQQALSIRKSFVENNGDDSDIPSHTYSNFKKYRNDDESSEYKGADTGTYHKRVRTDGSGKRMKPTAQKKLKFKDTLEADYFYHGDDDGESNVPSSSTTAQPYTRSRKRLRTRKPQNLTENADNLDNSDSIVQYHYISPDEAVRHMRRPLVSKSPTIKHSDSSTSTSYYYEPIVTKVVEDEPKVSSGEKTSYNWKNHGFGFNSSTIHSTEGTYTSGFKSGAPPQNDFEAYYYTHPTPSPPFRATTTTPTSTKRPYVEVKGHGHVSQKPRINKKRPSKPVDSNIKANVYTNSDNGADNYPAASYPVSVRPYTKPKVYRFKAKPNQKTKIIIRTHRPSKSDSSMLPDEHEPEFEEEIDESEVDNVSEFESAETQVVPDFKVPPSVKTAPNEVKIHTPKFELNDYEKTRVPVYYNVDVQQANATVIPPYNNGDKKGKSFTPTLSVATTTQIPPVVAGTKPTPFPRLNPTKTPDTTYVYPAQSDIDNQIHPDETHRSMMTFAPDDDAVDQVTQKGLKVGDDKDLEPSESKPNKYVVVYSYEDEPKKKHPPPPPRPKTTAKPTIVQQQIHYHHHGGNTETKTRSAHGQGGTYQGSWGGRGGGGGGAKYDEEDDDDGPDVTHTHHEYVHFDEEPSITHLYNDGPMTDHYSLAKPAANAVYDMKTAKDYDFRHTASHDLDTRHVPVADYDGLRYSHMHNSGKLNGYQKERNNYGERPYYWYDSERQTDLYDNEAYGSSPKQSVVKPYESSSINRQTIKVVDPINPKSSIEITKDDYVKHVKLAVEKYLQSKEKAKSGGLLVSTTSKPSYSGHRYYGGDSNRDEEDDDQQNSYTKHRPYLSVHDYNSPPKSYLKPLEKPLNYNEGTTQGKVPLNDDTYNKLRDTLENSYMTPIKPVTLPPKRLQQLTKLMASTPSSFQATRPDPRPQQYPQQTQYSQQQQSSQPNFNIMKTLKYPKDFYGAGKGMSEHIYNLQDSISNDVDLTVKHVKPMGNQIDMSAIEVGQMYHHGNNYDAHGGASQATSAFHRPRLHFNQQSHQEINSLTHGNNKQAGQKYRESFGGGNSGRRPGGATPPPQRFQGVQDTGAGAQSNNFAQSGSGAGLGTALNNELQNAPIQIINGIPIANPYGIDMDTLRYMLGGMPGGMTMTKDPNDPFNMKTLKSIPNIANIPSLSSTASDSFAFSTMPKPNFGSKYKGPPQSNPVKQPPARPYSPKNFNGPNPGYNGYNGGNKNFGGGGRSNVPNAGGHGQYRPNQNGHSYSNNGNGMGGGFGDNYQNGFKPSASTNTNNYYPQHNANSYNDDGFSPITNPYMNQNDNYNPLAWRQDNARTPYDDYSSSPTKRPTPEPQLYLRAYRRVPSNGGPSGKSKPKHNRQPETSLRPPPPMFRKKFVSKES